MANETGHARNVESFQQLVAYVQGYGATYNPSNPAITLVNLQALLTQAQSGIDGVTAALAPYKAAVNDRETLYAPLEKLTTRIINAYAASGTDENNIDDAKTFARKIQGRRKTAVIEDDPNTPEDESAASHSAAQLSYVQQVEHLDNLIAIIKADAMYAPNETELTTNDLEKYSEDMKTANQAVINTYPLLSNSRIVRNDMLYTEKTGLFDVAQTVKKYVKAAFGADSAEFAQIKGLKFTEPR